MPKRGISVHELRRGHPYGLYGGEPGLETGQSRYIIGISGSNSPVESTNGNTGRLWASVFMVPRDIKIDQLACEITTAQAASNVRLGLYRSTKAGGPGALVVESGALASATTGSKTASVSAVLTPGVYWGAWEYDTASVGFRGRGDTAGLSMGFSGTVNTPFGVLYGNHTFGAFPDPFPAIANRFNLGTQKGHVVYARVV